MNPATPILALFAAPVLAGKVPFGHAATLARLCAEMLRQREAFGDAGAFWRHYRGWAQP